MSSLFSRETLSCHKQPHLLKVNDIASHDDFQVRIHSFLMLMSCKYSQNHPTAILNALLWSYALLLHQRSQNPGRVSTPKTCILYIPVVSFNYLNLYVACCTLTLSVHKHLYSVAVLCLQHKT